jgi:hypothetical protein
MVNQTRSQADEERAQSKNIREENPAAQELYEKLGVIPDANKDKIIVFVFSEIPNTPFDGKTWDKERAQQGEEMLDVVLGASGEATEAISNEAHSRGLDEALDAAGDAAQDAVLAAVRKAVGDEEYNKARAAGQGTLRDKAREALMEALGGASGEAAQGTAQGETGDAAEEAAGKVAWLDAVQEAAYSAALLAGSLVTRPAAADEDPAGLSDEDKALIEHSEYAREHWNACVGVLVSAA